MTMAVEEILGLGRETDRVLEELAPESPERAQLSHLVVDPRPLHQRLTASIDRSECTVRATSRTAGHARRVLDQAEQRFRAG